MKHNQKVRKIVDFLESHPYKIYPVVIITIVLILTCFRISGTSIGIYNSYLYGDTSKDKNLLYNKPQPIRSDEWLVATQLAIAQSKNGFPMLNSNFLARDTSIVADVPYLDWSSVFHPQNLAFFIVPFEFAFAFKWWFLMAALLLSSYYFCLKILNKNIVLSVLFSVFTGLSPFVFWWYQSATILPLAYGFIIMLLGMSIIDNNRLTFFGKNLSSTRSAAIKSLSLSYILVCFVLLFYPPFQVPVVLLCASFLLGYLLNKNKKYLMENYQPILKSFGASILVALVVCGVFFLQHKDTIHAISNTAYPGQRVVASGGYDIKRLMVTYLQPLLQIADQGPNYIKNQSESSNFILPPLFLLPLAMVLLLYNYFKRKKTDWILFFLILCNLLFLADLLVPNIDIITRLTLLHLVPHDRLVLGLGFVNIVIFVYLVRLISKAGRDKVMLNIKAKFMLFAYSVLFLVLAVWAGIITKTEYPGFISTKKDVAVLALIAISPLALMILGKKKLGLSILAVFSLFSVYQIHPLYIGLGPIYDSKITKAIQELSSKGSVWVATENAVVENLPQMSGRGAITGVSTYPNLEFWDKYSGMKDSKVYNRYAHVIATSNNAAPLILLGPDIFAVSNVCGTKANQIIDFSISVEKSKSSCDHLIKTLVYPNITFYFYRVSH
jgi:hypothetical protein